MDEQEFAFDDEQDAVAGDFGDEQDEQQYEIADDSEGEQTETGEASYEDDPSVQPFEQFYSEADGYGEQAFIDQSGFRDDDRYESGQGTDFENLGDSYDASYNSGQDTDWQSFSGYDQGDDSNGYGVDFQDLQNTSWPETTDGYSNNGSFDPYAQGGGQDDWENPSGGFLSGYGQDLVTDPALLGGVAQGFGDLDFGLQDSDSYGNDNGQTSAAQNGVDAYSGTYMPEGYGMPEGVNGFFNAELDSYGTLPPGALAMGGSDPTTPGNRAGALGGPVKPTNSPTNNGTPRNPETESGSVDIKVRQNPEGGGSFSGEYCQSEKGGSTSVSAQLDINERGQVGGEIHYKHKYGGAPTGQNNCQE